MQNRSETNPFILNNILFSLKTFLDRETNMTLFFNSKRINSVQVIKNNVGRRHSDQN